MFVNGVYFWYYNICKREVWLYGKSIKCNQDNENVSIGKFMHMLNYPKNKKEIEFGMSKFDVVIKSSGKIKIIENKKSTKYMESSKMQLAYYLFLLEKSGVYAEGIIACPLEKNRVKVILTDDIRLKINEQCKDIQKIINSSRPPAVFKCRYCKKCAYNEYCFS